MIEACEGGVAGRFWREMIEMVQTGTNGGNFVKKEVVERVGQ